MLSFTVLTSLALLAVFCGRYSCIVKCFMQLLLMFSTYINTCWLIHC